VAVVEVLGLLLILAGQEIRHQQLHHKVMLVVMVEIQQAKVELVAAVALVLEAEIVLARAI
jgi:hypothetical protein